MNRFILSFLLLIFVLVSCNSERQDIQYQEQEELLDTLCWEEPNTISTLVLKAFNSIDKDTFFQICQILNDSFGSRTNNYLSFSVATTIFVIDEINGLIRLGFVEVTKSLPPGIPDRLVFDICIKDEKTFIQYEQASLDGLKERAKKYLFEIDSIDKSIALKKQHTDLFGEVEIPKVGVILSINAKENKLSSNEWLLLFRCLHEIVDVFEENRDSLSMEKLGKNFNALTFEQKEAISDIADYHILLIFDSECYCKSP